MSSSSTQPAATIPRSPQLLPSGHAPPNNSLARKASNTSSSDGFISSGPTPDPLAAVAPMPVRSPLDRGLGGPVGGKSSHRRMTRHRTVSNASSTTGSASGASAIHEALHQQQHLGGASVAGPQPPTPRGTRERMKSSTFSRESGGLSAGNGAEHDAESIMSSSTHGGGAHSTHGTHTRHASQQHPQLKKIEEISEIEVAKMKALFMQHDRDNSGSIDAHELQDLLRAMGYPMSEGQAFDLLKQVDTNDNGTLELEEFQQLIRIFKDAAQFRLYDESDVRGHIKKASSKFTKVLPDAHWMWARDVLMVLITMYCIVASTVLWMPSGERDFSRFGDALLVTDILVTFPLAFEMFVRFQTSHVVGNRMTESTALIVKRYGTFWFWVDLLALLPMRLFSSDQTTSLVLAHFRLLRVLRFPTHFETSNQMALTRAYINFHFVFVPTFMQLCYFVTLVHVCAVAWYRLYEESQSYSACIYITMYFLSGVGLGEIPVDTEARMIFSCVSCILALAVNALVVGNIVALLNQADVEGMRKSHLVEMQAVLHFFDVPEPLQEEILQFQNHVLTRDVEKSFGYLIDHLPGEIKGNLSLEIKLNLLLNAPCIAEAHKTVQIAIARCLETVIFIPEYYISVAGEVADEVFFVNFGFVDVFSAMGVYIETLSRDSTFALECILVGASSEFVHEHSAKSLSYVETLVLPRDAFERVAAGFPRFYMEMETLRGAFERRRLESALKRRSSEAPAVGGVFNENMSLDMTYDEVQELHDGDGVGDGDAQIQLPHHQVPHGSHGSHGTGAGEGGDSDDDGSGTLSNSLEEHDPVIVTRTSPPPRPEDARSGALKQAGSESPPPTYRGVKLAPRTPPLLNLGHDRRMSSQGPQVGADGMLTAPQVQLLLSPRSSFAADKLGEGGVGGSARASSQRHQHDAIHGAMTVPSALLQRGDADELLAFSVDVLRGLDELVDEVIALAHLSCSSTPRNELAQVPSTGGVFHGFQFGAEEQPQMVVVPPPDE